MSGIAWLSFRPTLQGYLSRMPRGYSQYPQIFNPRLMGTNGSHICQYKRGGSASRTRQGRMRMAELSLQCRDVPVRQDGGGQEDLVQVWYRVPRLK